MNKSSNNLNFVKAVKSVLDYTKEYKKWYIISLILMVLFILSEIITNTAFSYSLSNVIEKNFDIAIKYIIIYMIVSFVGLNVLHYYHHKISKKVSIKFAQKIRINLYEKIVKMSHTDFEKINVGELFTTVENANEQMISILTKYLWAVTKVLYLIILFIIILFIDVRIWALVAVVLLSLTILTRIYVTKSKKITNQEYEKTYEASTLLNQTILGFKELKVLDVEKTYIKKYKTINDELCKLKTKKANYWVNTNVVRWDIWKISDLFLILILIVLISKFNFDTTKVILLSTYISNIINIYFTHIIENSIDVPSFIKNIEKNMKILSDNEIKEEKFGSQSLSSINGVVEFNNVSFKYENSKFFLKNISFKNFPNRKTALVGKSGSGKSTIMKLMLHYYDNYSGSIKIDGIDLKEIDKKSLIDNISVVYQDPFIFNLSIKDNILLSNEDATNEEFENACKKAKLDEFVLQMPDGYDTIINDKSTNLSGGQKQRIAIARAIIKNSKIILFDEPTSALDKENTEYIKDLIDELSVDKTVIVVSHDMKLIKDFDDIIYIKDGIIEKQGSELYE
jgi:ATP-binding cassette subfamily B protein